MMDYFVMAMIALVVALLVDHFDPLWHWHFRWCWKMGRDLVGDGFEHLGKVGVYNPPFPLDNDSAHIAVVGESSPTHATGAVWVSLPTHGYFVIRGVTPSEACKVLVSRTFDPIFNSKGGAGQETRHRLIATLKQVEQQITELGGDCDPLDE